MNEEQAITEINAFEAEVRLINHLKASTTGRPGCGKAGCINGVIGVSTYTGADHKPHLHLIPCKCSQMGKSEYALINQRITDLISHITNVIYALEQVDTERINSLKKEISNEISTHHETMSQQIEEAKEIILRHSVLWQMRKSWEWIVERYYLFEYKIFEKKSAYKFYCRKHNYKSNEKTTEPESDI